MGRVNAIFVSAKLLVVYTAVLMESSHEKTLHVERLNLLRSVCGGRSKKVKAVSYTHLTLPTSSYV